MLGALSLLLSDSQVRHRFMEEDKDHLLVQLIRDVLSTTPQAKGKMKKFMLTSSALNAVVNEGGGTAPATATAPATPVARGGGGRPQTAVGAAALLSPSRSQQRPLTASASSTRGRKTAPAGRIELNSISGGDSRIQGAIQQNIAIECGLSRIPPERGGNGTGNGTGNGAGNFGMSSIWVAAIQLGWLLVRSGEEEASAMVNVGIPTMLLKLTLSRRRVASDVRGASASLLQLFMSEKMRARLRGATSNGAPTSPPIQGTLGKERHFNELLVITLLLLGSDELILEYAAKECAKMAIGKRMKVLLRRVNAIPALLALSDTRSPQSKNAEYAMQGA